MKYNQIIKSLSSWGIFLLVFLGVTKTQGQSPVWKGNINLEPNSLNFLVVGDWGRNGEDHQAANASMMENFAKKYSISFIISTGDNIYENGVNSIDDASWKTSFEDIYSGPHLQVPWYCVLGNHDYRGLVQAEIDYTQKSKRWIMPSRYYFKNYPTANSDSILMVFMDTSPFIHSYRNQGGKYGDIDHQDSTKQIHWLDSLLGQSRAKWKFVFGHHPVYSAGSAHGTSEDLVNILNPVLVKNKVQFYICGHDHDLQHLTSPDSPVDYIVSGAGSRTRLTGFIQGLSKFSNGNTGFALISIYKNKTKVYLINYLGDIIYGMEKGL